MAKHSSRKGAIYPNTCLDARRISGKKNF